MKYLALILAFLSLQAFADGNKRVIGRDTRYKITARNHRTLHDSIGLLVMSFKDGQGLCTGTVIGPRHVVTAAHCLVDKGAFVKDVFFIPGLTGDVLKVKYPFGSFSASKLRVIKAYISTGETESDLGLVTFNENLPVSALPLRAMPSGKQKITITGYPGDKTTGEMWEGKGERLASFLDLLTGEISRHDVDTYSGQSGSAVRSIVGGVEAIVGIHSSGVQGRFSDYNEAYFFNSESVNALKKWMIQDR